MTFLDLMTGVLGFPVYWPLGFLGIWGAFIGLITFNNR